MTELVTLLEGLADRYETIPARLAMTLLSIALVLTISWLAHTVRNQVGDRIRGAVADLAVSLALAVAIAFAAAIIIGVWGFTGTVIVAIQQAGIGADTGGRIVLTVALFTGTYVFVGFVRRFIDELVLHHDSITQHQREVTYRVTQVALYITAIIVALGLWEVDLSGFLIGAGFLGIIVGMAARQTIGSMLAGFVLMFSRPFEVGDWIAVEDDEGIVTDITIVNTRIETFDGEYVMIPNDVVSGTTVTNRTRKGRLRLRVEVGVDYATDIVHAAEVAREAMRDVEEIMRVPTPQVATSTFADSAIVLELRFWIDKPSSRRRWRAKQAVIRSVKSAFEREGIKIPFPQQELSGRAETGGFRIAGGREPELDTEGSGSDPVKSADDPTPQADGSGPQAEGSGGDGEGTDSEVGGVNEDEADPENESDSEDDATERGERR